MTRYENDQGIEKMAVDFQPVPGFKFVASSEKAARKRKIGCKRKEKVQARTPNFVTRLFHFPSPLGWQNERPWNRGCRIPTRKYPNQWHIPSPLHPRAPYNRLPPSPPPQKPLTEVCRTNLLRQFPWRRWNCVTPQHHCHATAC